MTTKGIKVTASIRERNMSMRLHWSQLAKGCSSVRWVDTMVVNSPRLNELVLFWLVVSRSQAEVKTG
jgi:hypothetical protein